MVRLEQVSKLYFKHGQVIHALESVDFHARAGEFISVVGPSGSGKTTLMNIMGCLDTPTTGRYLLAGEPVTAVRGRQADRARNRRIGFIFQGFNLINNLTALENTELPLTLRGISRQARRTLALEALSQVGLENRAGHRPGELSGGQQQRVAIARVLAARPQLILADEPTGNLDRRTGREVIAALGALHNMGHTVIMITHDVQAAAAAGRVLTMEGGQLSERL